MTRVRHLFQLVFSYIKFNILDEGSILIQNIKDTKTNIDAAFLILNSEGFLINYTELHNVSTMT